MKLIENTVALIAPHRCIVCKAEGSLLCSACQASSLAAVPSRCYRCHKISTKHAVCKSCRSSVALSHVWIATHYEEAAKELIRQFKYQRARAGSLPIACSIDDTVPVLPGGLVVCHVPTANSRIRSRGYDQAEEILKEFCRLRNWRRRKILIRKGNTRQVGSGRKERFRHLEEALELRKDADVLGKHILLIDDVTTTGATLEAAAKLVKKHGAKTVDAAVFAQPS